METPLTLSDSEKQASLIRQANKLPVVPGVYLFKDKTGRVLYVGKSTNLRDRVKTHLLAKGEKSQALIRNSSRIESIPVSYDLEALLLEADLIKKYLPRYNSRAKDDKHPLYIKITVNEEFPKIFTSRKEDLPGVLYFGPFPSSSTTREVLRDLRKIFPYCAQKRIGGKPCFYSHIGLCNPCPGGIKKIKDKNLREALKSEYKKNIKKIIMLLSGKTGRLVKSLIKEMRTAAKNEDFERAMRLRDQIRGLEYITTPYKDAKIYLQNPNFLEELRKSELLNLQSFISKWIPNFRFPKRVEYLDVAHLAGESASASLVVFTGGEPEKRFYRRFKIITKKTRDDFSMMREVVQRRLKHLADWGKPDILVVDGGKAQVSAARGVFLEKSIIDIPIIGFAKRFEEIVIHDGEQFHIVRLKQGDLVLNLLRRLEEEGHRFARSYHFKLRLKKVFET